MQTLRLTNGRCTPWVDAICINQVDKQEKGRQVAHMGQIYRAATRVIVWLGLDLPSNDRCRSIGLILEDLSRVFDDLNDDHVRFYRAGCNLSSVLSELNISGLLDIPWYADLQHTFCFIQNR